MFPSLVCAPGGLGFALPIFEEDGIKVSKNTVVIDPGKLDRSPCGTGCSARMAVLHAKGELNKGDQLIGRSILNSRWTIQEKEMNANEETETVLNRFPLTAIKKSDIVLSISA